MMKKVLCLSAALVLHLTFGPRPGLASGSITNCTEAALRTALIGGGSVIFSCDTVIPLSSTLVISKDVVLDGTGHAAGLSTSGITNAGRVIWIQPGASLTLRNLTISGGTVTGGNGTNGTAGIPAFGAGIYNDHGSLVLDGCTISGHTVTGGNGSSAVTSATKGGNAGPATGAALYNYGGRATITNSIFSGNRAAGGVGGTGGSAQGAGNGSQGGNGGDGGLAAGAAIHNTGSGQMVVWNSLFTSNQVVGGVAGAGATGGLIVGFTGDSGASGSGVGAGIYSDSGTLTVINSTFLSNSAQGSLGNTGAAGSTLVDVQNGFNGGLALGGGIYAGAGTAALTNCTFAANALTGGTGGTGGAGNPNFFGSSGGKGGAGGDALGGGIYDAPAATVQVVNCTFSDNAVQGGTPGAGGAAGGVGSTGSVGRIGTAAGAAVYGGGGAVILRNSILASSQSGSNVAGAVQDLGYNLNSDASLTVKAAGSRNLIDPGLGGLTTVGVVPIITLSSNSPAVNAIASSTGNGAPGFDARNASRVTPFDIGAYEEDGVTASPSLQATVQSNQVVVSWPAASGFVLQSTSQFAATNKWTAATNQVTTVGSTQQVTISPANSGQFFRLAQ